MAKKKKEVIDGVQTPSELQEVTIARKATVALEKGAKVYVSEQVAKIWKQKGII